MFREIRKSEKVTENSANRNYNRAIEAILDRRVEDWGTDLDELLDRKNNNDNFDDFDPDKRICTMCISF